MKMDLIDQEKWDKSYRQYDLDTEISQSNPIYEWIQTSSSLNKDANSIEIGIFPGIYTKIFGEMGHEINGIDLTPRVTELAAYFKSKQFKTGEFIQENFFEYKPDRKYGIVFSIGFIEHFNDYKSVIEKHCELVNENGILLLIVPNFRGKVQYFLHKMIDIENLKRHNVLSMNPEEWITTVVNKGFEIVRHGYIGSFHFWCDSQKRNIIQKGIKKLLKHTDSILGKTVMSRPSASWSPYCGIIARKISAAPPSNL